jgi:mRNA interferase HigB
VRVVSYTQIKKFCRKHANARKSLNAWYRATSMAIWRNLDDVKKTFAATDIFKCCTIFNIGGNNYRLIAIINYKAQIVYIREILTHAEYDKDKWKDGCT